MVNYKMIGKDIDCSIEQYRTWVVEDYPDFDGYVYSGLKAGDHPLINICAYLLDGYTTVDFNLPLPLTWKSTKHVLPNSIELSQLAIVDGYVYLFGGMISNKIFRAPLADPCQWEDTNYVLPTYLYASQLAIIGDTIYLFGGDDGYGPTKKILSASINNPLIWTDHGDLLPINISHSSLCLVDSRIFLFGGKTSNNKAISNIYTAVVVDPLSWIDTGNNLIDPLYNSNIGVINDNMYLFGGFDENHITTKNIYVTEYNNPVNWSFSNYLPYAISGSQYVRIGNKAYLFTAASISNEPRSKGTRILQVNFDTPNQWLETNVFIPGEIYNSQLAIIYDRLFLFGGSGNSSIFTCECEVKYNLTSEIVVEYGNITRTLYQSCTSQSELFKTLGFAFWKTNYKNNL